MVVGEVERHEEDKETVGEAVKMYAVVDTETISSARTKKKIGTIITPLVNPSSTTTAPSEIKSLKMVAAVGEDKEVIGVAKAEEEDEVVIAGLEVVEAREAGNLIKLAILSDFDCR